MGYANTGSAAVGARHACSEIIERQPSLSEGLDCSFFSISNTHGTISPVQDVKKRGMVCRSTDVLAH